MGAVAAVPVFCFPGTSAASPRRRAGTPVAPSIAARFLIFATPSGHVHQYLEGVVTPKRQFFVLPTEASVSMAAVGIPQGMLPLSQYF
jgi:hypothetical protein